MKFLTIVLSLFICQSVFAEASDPRSLFATSQLVQETVSNIERQHQVTCEAGKSSALFPRMLKSVKYVAKCGGIKLKISAKFKNVLNPVFALKEIKVWNKNKILFMQTEEFILNSDPFLRAYKNSQLVRDVRHFVENNYEVVCNSGRVRKGYVGGKANYFFFAKCKAENKKTINIKLKSKVEVYEDRFRFKLSKYKLSL
jgi:hypothetical protein